MADAKAAAAKERIISHLNNDHQRELSHYLRHWASLSPSVAKAPVLQDITFDNMLIKSRNGKIHSIPISPPMISWADARQRAVDMDKTAREALGISDIVVDIYTLPQKPLHVIVAALCALTYLGFILRPFMKPGTALYDNVLAWFPGGAEMFLELQGKVLLPMLAIHLGEVVYLHRTRLRKHHVGGSVSWKWAGSCFVEGFGSFQRFDGVVRRKTMEKEKAKH